MPDLLGLVKRGACLAIALAATAALASHPAAARSKHRHHLPSAKTAQTRPVQARPVQTRPLPIPQAYSYYPNEIEGGVSGNLPFNNQIRKFKDPLNANGGR